MARALYLVIIGPDGSGKTAVADELARGLDGDRIVRRLNFNFGVLPSLSTLAGRPPRRGAPEGALNSGMVRPLGAARASVLGVWYGIDHLLGHFVLRRSQPKEVVIFARSYHDFLYQRAFVNLPLAIPRLFLALGPKPDLVVTPVRDPEAILLDKPELSQEEVRSQYARIVARLARFGRFAEIDASEGIASTAMRIRNRLGL